MMKFLKKTFLGKKILSLFGGRISEEKLEELETLFFEADLGATLSHELTESVRHLLKKNANLSNEDVIREMKQQLISTFPLASKEKIDRPLVILIVGVNGNGKTTTIAKLAKLYKDQGKSVLIAAADTFRAAAIDQLEIWAQRISVEIVKGLPKGDPAAVAFDAIQAAVSRGIDVVLIDTAGRLHTKTDLMQELQKIARVANKAKMGAPHETFLILDATVGQNGIEQASLFHQYTPLTGLILTKLDGTAKGGTALALQKKVPVPIRFIGVGEKLEDLLPFDPKNYVDQLFE